MWGSIPASHEVVGDMLGVLAMTGQEFRAWLEGFLDGKQDLTADEVKKLRAKAQTIRDEKFKPDPWPPARYESRNPYINWDWPITSTAL